MDTSLLVKGLQLSEIDKKWPTIRPILNRALNHNSRFNDEDIKKLAKESKVQIFYTSSSVCVTEIIVFPRMKILNIFLMAGDMTGVDCLTLIEQWAKDNGCAEIEETGRAGWAKVLVGQGYEKTTITMRKTL